MTNGTYSDIVKRSVKREKLEQVRAAAPDLLEALEVVEREMKIAHNHVSPALQPSIAANLRTAILVANTALAKAGGKSDPYVSGDDISLDPETAQQYRQDRIKDDLP